MPDKWINWALVKEPLNWAVIMVTATIWLLAFHVIMKGFGAMSGQTAFSPGPGLTASPSSSTANFETSGNALTTGGNPTLGGWWGGGVASGDGTWTDGSEARYAMDGDNYAY